MNKIKKLSFYVIFCLMVFNACKKQLPKSNPQEEVWIDIFDGKNIKDWTPKFTGFPLGENYKNRFVCENNLLSVRYELQDTFKAKFGHLFYKEKFSHYRIKANYRFIGEQMLNGPAWAFRNNGLMLHSQSPQSMGLEQDFPISLEVQLLGGNDKGERPNGNLCTPGTNIMMSDTLFTSHCVNSSSKTYHGDQWVTIEVLVLGDSLIQHILEDKVVLEYKHPTIGGGMVKGHDQSYASNGSPIKDGYISIQAETHPIDFKSISVLNLCGCMDAKAKNYKSYFVKADNTTCIY